jgi:hypothetical protein
MSRQSQQIEKPQVPSPSLAKILLATVAALAVSAVLLVTAILPAEYGIDPLGTGKGLGLMDLANSAGAEAAPIPEATISPRLGPTGTSKFGLPGANRMGVFIAQPKRYKIDSREIILDPGEGMEIKYNMKKGAGLIYSWNAEKPLLFEFHGDPDKKPPDASRDYFESYAIDDSAGKDQSHGTFVAPNSGIHGWFWQNTSAEQVTLKLVSAGFYDWIMEARKDKQKALDPMDPK